MKKGLLKSLHKMCVTDYLLLKMEKEKITKEKKTQETEEIKAREIAIIRISTTDIPGKMSVYSGLTKIKGISWAFSNAICKTLAIDKTRKISTLTNQEIEKIINFIKNPKLPSWLLNRRKDIETGIDKHLITIELDLQNKFDIRRFKKIKSYKGTRHFYGLPVRGQHTRAHFRKNRSVGVQRSKVKQQSKKKK